MRAVGNKRTSGFYRDKQPICQRRVRVNRTQTPPVEGHQFQDGTTAST
jgi:hypothetical protein